MSKLYRFLLYCGWFLASMSLALGADDAAWVERLRREAPAGWQRWHDGNLRLEAQFHNVQVRLKEGGETYFQSNVVNHVYHKGNSRRHDIDTNTAKGVRYESSTVRNADRYFFSVERRNGSAYVMTDASATETAQSRMEFPRALESPYSIEFLDLRSLLKNPRFTIESVTVPSSKDEATSRMTFRYDVKGEKNPRFASGWVDLLPDDGWAVRRYQIVQPDGYQVRKEIQYGPRRDGFRPLIKMTREFLGKTGAAIGSRDEQTFDSYEIKKVPDDVFTLSAFGLPEMDSMRNRGGIHSIWFWFFNAGVVLIIIGFLIRSRWQGGARR